MASLPLRLGDDRRTRPGKRRRCKPVELAVLPLADAPYLLQQAVLELHLADDRIEGAGADLIGHRGAVDLADLLDRLLQHLQARIGDGAGPAVRLLARRGLVTG